MARTLVSARVCMPAALAMAATVAACVGGCSSNKAADATPTAPAAKVSALPAAAAELAPLAFMAGQWVAVNPNKTVNREHWTPPAGRTMTGMFHQMRPNGTPTFYEYTTIVAEKDGVMLYHRHMHLKLAIDERRKDVDVFRLDRVELGSPEQASGQAGAPPGFPRAVFVPVSGNAATDQGIESMAYRLDGPDRLVQEITFKPGSKEKSFSSVYTRE